MGRVLSGPPGCIVELHSGCVFCVPLVCESLYGFQYLDDDNDNRMSGWALGIDD
ncbi:hypothetical protein FA13DRAFT_1731041 [Coprinellus micaceus]|uniref:Uncharacterized protein n=1 Tax=Coprinellus micaceus TaxID=71717 RepID=A0A4Y7TH25_COPMI|nr:hypothetical protein FA13DRAFT_1731041 [Coprinellus micaceus]